MFNTNKMEGLPGVLLYKIAEYTEIEFIPAIELFSTTL